LKFFLNSLKAISVSEKERLLKKSIRFLRRAFLGGSVGPWPRAMCAIPHSWGQLP